MRVAEIFYSIQGEGRLVGVPSVFIRTSGCNLRCVWCDTPYTSWKPDGTEMSVEQICRAVEEYPLRHAVITGGEPFLAPELEPLAARLKSAGAHVTIETAATIFRAVACDLMSMSPKLSNSTPLRRQHGRFAAMHERQRLNFAVMQRFIDDYDFQLKFVVESAVDFEEVNRVLERLVNVAPHRVLIMPQAKTRAEVRARSRWIVELCKKYGFAYSPRLHIELYGNRRGI